MGAVLPGFLEVERAVPAVPVAGMVVTLGITDLVAGMVRTVRDLARFFEGQRGNVLADAPRKLKVQDVAVEPVEVDRAIAPVVR